MQITVKYYSQKIEDINKVQAFTLKVEVVSAVDMPEAIFVFQRHVLSATDSEANNYEDTFISLADPVDMEEYPENSPNLNDDVPYFRMNEVTLKFRDSVDMEEVKDLIKADIQKLVNSLNASEDLEETEEVVYVPEE